jgi:hypothetical protein
MEAIRSSETLAYTTPTRRHIPKDGILHSHGRENLKYYIIMKTADTIKKTMETAKTKTATTLRYSHGPCHGKKESYSHCELRSQMNETFHSHKLLFAYMFIFYYRM